MPRYRTSEYQHLIKAERALAKALDPIDVEGVLVYPKDIASIASSLARVVEQKRIMRGQPAPKPADRVDKRARTTHSALAPAPIPPSA